MKYVKKILKWTGILILALLVIANLAIIFTGRYYIYKGIANTYFRGHIRPTIYDLDVFENRAVEIGKPQPWVEHPQLGSFAISAEQRETVESLNPSSLLVAWGDTLIYEEYWGEHDQNQISNSFSMAKSIVSLLIGVALDEGKIKSLDEPVANYLPEFDDEKKDITIRHILTMSSGLSWTESYVSPFCDVAELYYDTDDRDLALNRRTIEEDPGLTFKYKSGDTQVLMYILMAATGTSVSDYASEKLWIPMGAESEAMWSLVDDEKSSEKAFCCFYSTSRDFIRLGKLVNNDGNWNGRQLVSAAYVNEFSSLAPLKEPNGKANSRYAFQYWVYTGMPYEVTYFRGMSGQYIISIPEKDLVIVRTGSGTMPSWKNTETVTDDNLEGHYQELPSYIAIGVTLMAQAGGK
ncbi:MAG: CubicO group peptidase (beta-lactamase class C family) [Crocinitomix sp.]|jgi:CubicO group peptidase (beta-lactamase class C family)